MKIRKERIRAYILSMKSSGQIINNISRNRVGQIGKAFFIPPAYFVVMHSDICHISHLRPFINTKKLLITLIDSLSGYGFVEIVKSTASKHVVTAFNTMLMRGSTLIPKSWKRLMVDFGSEYFSADFKKMFRKKNPL